MFWTYIRHTHHLKLTRRHTKFIHFTAPSEPYKKKNTKKSYPALILLLTYKNTFVFLTKVQLWQSNKTMWFSKYKNSLLHIVYGSFLFILALPIIGTICKVRTEYTSVRQISHYLSGEEENGLQSARFTLQETEFRLGVVQFRGNCTIGLETS